MIKYVLISASLFLFSNVAEARHYRHHYHHYAHHYTHHRHYAHHYNRHVYHRMVPVHQSNWFGDWSGSPTGNESSRSFGALGRPARAIYGHLVCALNVNAALAERGIKGTGSALAMSFMHWGHSAGGPVPGAVIVSHRRGGGHVAIVSRVVNGQVYAWNASERSGWREIPYHKHVIDYRVPG